MGANNADSGGLGGVSCQGLLCLVSKGSAELEKSSLQVKFLIPGRPNITVVTP